MCIAQVCLLFTVCISVNVKHSIYRVRQTGLGAGPHTCTQEGQRTEGPGSREAVGSAPRRNQAFQGQEGLGASAPALPPGCLPFGTSSLQDLVGFMQNELTSKNKQKSVFLKHVLAPGERPPGFQKLLHGGGRLWGLRSREQGTHNPSPGQANVPSPDMLGNGTTVPAKPQQAQGPTGPAPAGRGCLYCPPPPGAFGSLCPLGAQTELCWLGGQVGSRGRGV